MNGAFLPKPTRDLESARRDLEEHGVCLVEGALLPERLEQVHRRLYEAAEEDLAAGRSHRIEVPGVDFDETNQRVWALLDKGDAFVELVQDPVALDLVRHVLGWPALLSNVTANITGPGGGDMLIHCDELVNPHGAVRDGHALPLSLHCTLTDG